MLEHRIHVAIRPRADGDGPGTRGVQPRRAVAVGQPQQPETGSIPLFRVRPALEKQAMAKVRSELKEHEEIIEVWEKDPSTPAFTDLMNRALDKPKEQEMQIKLTDESEMIQRLLAGRQRTRPTTSGSAACSTSRISRCSDSA